MGLDAPTLEEFNRLKNDNDNLRIRVSQLEVDSNKHFDRFDELLRIIRSHLSPLEYRKLQRRLQ